MPGRPPKKKFDVVGQDMNIYELKTPTTAVFVQRSRIVSQKYWVSHGNPTRVFQLENGEKLKSGGYGGGLNWQFHRVLQCDEEAPETITIKPTYGCRKDVPPRTST